MTTNAAQGRDRQALLWFGKISLAKDAKFIRVLWEFGAFILIVNSILPEKWVSAASCLYWVGSESGVNPAYTSSTEATKEAVKSEKRSSCPDFGSSSVKAEDYVQ